MFKDLGEWIGELRKSLEVVSAEEAKSLVDMGSGILIDVREPAEAHVAAKGSINVPRGVLEMQLPALIPDPKTSLLIHCATGGRATFAASQLKSLGYQDVKVIGSSVELIIESFGAK